MTDDRDFERNFWGNCINTFDEEQKHYVYAREMGLAREGYSFRLPEGVSTVMDIGGGPVSMLLKCTPMKRISGEPYRPHVIIDPLWEGYPDWVHARYSSVGITGYGIGGEHVFGAGELDKLAELMRSSSDGVIFKTFDEAWIYNVLQHTEDPALIVQNALKLCRTLRIFEWIDIPAHEGHPHQLSADNLRFWLGAAVTPLNDGRVLNLAESGCYGRAFTGIFESPYNQARGKEYGNAT